MEGKRLIIGDFNLTLNSEIDRSSSKSSVHNSDKAANVLRQFMEDSLMSDIWRVHNLGLKRYTWRRKKPYVASRIDNYIIDDSIIGWVENIDIIPGYKSNHSAIKLDLTPYCVKRGPGVWKLNNRLLCEIDFVDKCNQEIENTCQLARNLDPQGHVESQKIALIQLAQKYSKEHAENRKVIINQLEENIRKLESQTSLESEESENLLAKTKMDLCEFVEEKTRAAVFRSRCTWYNEAGKSTKYFLNLEKNRSGSCSMQIVITEDGTEITEPNKILKEQYNFYEKIVHCG